jgi:hypothetical protein
MENPRKRATVATEAIEHGVRVFDSAQNKTNLLNATSALVWQHCDGKTSPRQLTDLLVRKFNMTGGQTEQLFASRSVITSHTAHSVAVIDSGQEGSGVPFSSQQGVWEHDSSGGPEARTLDFSFPFASPGSARVDCKFNAGVPANQVQGSIALTFFPPDGQRLCGGGAIRRPGPGGDLRLGG